MRKALTAVLPSSDFVRTGLVRNPEQKEAPLPPVSKWPTRACAERCPEALEAER